MGVVDIGTKAQATVTICLHAEPHDAW
jgi:hypothetical protein